MDLNADSVDYACSCGFENPGILTSWLTPGPLVLRRARHELKEQSDIPLSMVFSAMAVDCEVSRLYLKWTRIGALKQRRHLSNAELDESLRSLGFSTQRLKRTAELMHPAGLSDFVSVHREIRDWIQGGFPSLDVARLPETITEALYWPRNRILHVGDTKYDDVAARRSFNVAQLTIHIYQKLDAEKRKVLS
jgi:hypothetical protein